MVKIGDFIEVTRMKHFYTVMPLYMERVAADNDGCTFKIVAGGYSFSDRSDADMCRRGFRLRMSSTPSAEIDWHVVDPDVAWAAAVAEQLAGDS